MIEKMINLVKEWRKYLKMFSDKYVFNNGCFYPIEMKTKNWANF
jgi:hypothetical protein